MGMILVASSTACSLVLRPSASQCSTDGDCTAAGFTGTVCSAQNVCVANAAYCSTNKECNDRSPTQPSICRKSDNTCQQLFTADGACYRFISGYAEGDVTPLNDDNVVVFGEMSITTGSSPLVQGQGLQAELSVELVVDELKNELQGLPTSPSGPIRPVVFVACSDQTDNGKDPLVTARHLVEDLQVPAIIGPFTSNDGLTVAQSPEVLPKGVVELLPVAATGLLDKIPDRHLLLRYAIDDNWIDTYQALITTYLEPWVRQQQALAPSAGVKIAVMNPNDPISLLTSSEVFQRLQWNGGQSVQANLAAGNYSEVGTGSSPTDTAGRANGVAEMVQYAPHIIIVLGLADQELLIPQIEAAWTNAAYRPYYILSNPGIATVTQAAAAPLVGSPTNESLRQRVLGTTPSLPAASPVLPKYFIDYDTLFAAKNLPPSAVTGAYSDAAYTLLLASMSLTTAQPASQALGAEALAQALKTRTQPIAPSTSMDIVSHPSLFQDALHLLRAGQNIDYSGISGPCDFDSVGNAWSPEQVYCVNPNAAALPTRELQTGFFVDAPSTFTNCSGCNGGIGEGQLDKTACGFSSSLTP